MSCDTRKWENRDFEKDQNRDFEKDQNKDFEKDRWFANKLTANNEQIYINYDSIIKKIQPLTHNSYF